MNKEEKELLEFYRNLEPVNRINAMSNIRVAYATQENTKHHYGLAPDGYPTQAQTGQAVRAGA